MATAQEIYDEWKIKNQKYQDYTGGTQNFQNALETGYNAKMGENKDLIAQQNSLQNELYQMPTNLRASYMGGPVRNPLEQEALIGQRVGTAQESLQNVSDLLSNRKTRYEDILAKAMGQWGSETEATRLSAEAQWQAYLAQQAQEEAQRERDFQAQQAALDRALSGGGGGGGGGGFYFAGDTGGGGGGYTTDQERAIENAAIAAESNWDPSQMTAGSEGNANKYGGKKIYRSFNPSDMMAARNKELTRKKTWLEKLLYGGGDNW